MKRTNRVVQCGKTTQQKAFKIFQPGDSHKRYFIKKFEENRLRTFRGKIVEKIEICPESKFIPKSSNFELETLSRSVANFSVTKARGELKLKDFVQGK